MAEAPRAGWPARAVLVHHHRGPAGSLPSPGPTTPDPNKSLRGLLKTFGLVLGPGNTGALIRRAEALAEGNPTISGLVAKLADVRRHVVAQVAALDRDIRRLVRSEPALRRFMTVPGEIGRAHV